MNTAHTGSPPRQNACAFYVVQHQQQTRTRCEKPCTSPHEEAAILYVGVAGYCVFVRGRHGKRVSPKDQSTHKMLYRAKDRAVGTRHAAPAARGRGWIETDTNGGKVGLQKQRGTKADWQSVQHRN